MKNKYYKYAAVPYELKLKDNWIIADSRKIPYDIYGKGASVADKATWSSYHRALDALNKAQGSFYLGYVFDNSNIIGIDLDDAYVNGALTQRSRRIIDMCNSYTEKSVSGSGVHIFIKGELPFKGRNNRDGIEIYKSGRYFLMTGDKLCGEGINYNQEAIDYILTEYFGGGEYKGNKDNKDNKRKSSSVNNMANKDYVKNPYSYRPVYKKPDKVVYLQPSYPIINEGSRNTSLTSYAGWLKALNYDELSIYDELMLANHYACNPRLDIDEIVRIVKSVGKY